MVQLFTVVLQATSKIRLYAKGVTMGSVVGNLPNEAITSTFQIFLFGLLVNCLYPPVLLQMRSVRLQREMAAKIDIILDSIYMFTNLNMIFSGLAECLPIDPIAYLSCFWPVMHIFTACRAVETAVIQRIQEQQASKRAQKAHVDAVGARLPWWAALTYLAIALGTSAWCFHQSNQFYPFVDSCGKCSCREGTLLACAHLHPTLGAGIMASGAGITAIRPDAFDGLPNLKSLDLSDNGLDATDLTVLNSITTLEIVDLSNNPISNLPANAFEQLVNLRRIFLAGNPATCNGLILPVAAACYDQAVCDTTKCSSAYLPCRIMGGPFALSNAEETTADRVATCRGNYTPMVRLEAPQEVHCACLRPVPHATRQCCLVN